MIDSYPLIGKIIELSDDIRRYNESDLVRLPIKCKYYSFSTSDIPTRISNNPVDWNQYRRCTRIWFSDYFIEIERIVNTQIRESELDVHLPKTPEECHAFQRECERLLHDKNAAETLNSLCKMGVL